MALHLKTIQPVPTVCKLLRTKNAYAGVADEHEPWQFGESNTAVYWCLATMQTAGPDDVLATPDQCHAGRSCFKAAGM